MVYCRWFKADWVHFWLRASNVCLRRICVTVCICVFIEVICSWSIFDFSKGAVLWLNVSLWKMVLWRDNSTVFHNVALKISQAFDGNYTSNKALFQVWDWWGPRYLKGSRLIMLTSVSVLVLANGVLWVCCRWFGPLWCWNILPKSLLTMGSIIEWDEVMYMSDVSRVSNNSLIVGINVVERDNSTVFHNVALKNLSGLWCQLHIQ